MRDTPTLSIGPSLVLNGLLRGFVAALPTWFIRRIGIWIWVVIRPKIGYLFLMVFVDTAFWNTVPHIF